MDSKLYENMSMEDQLLISIGREMRPPIVRRPHCIFPINPQTLGALKNTVKSPFGVWNELLPDAEKRTAGEAGTEWPLIEGFRLWAEPQNQIEAMKFCGRLGQLHFCMLIDAETPMDLLKRLWSSAPPEFDNRTKDSPRIDDEVASLMDYWGDYLHWLDRSIDELKWACAGAYSWSDLDYGLFVTTAERAAIVSSFKNLLTGMGIKTATIDMSGDRAVWKGPNSLM